MEPYSVAFSASSARLIVVVVVVAVLGCCCWGVINGGLVRILSVVDNEDASIVEPRSCRYSFLFSTRRARAL
jgi:uncharacterized membrane protein